MSLRIVLAPGVRETSSRGVPAAWNPVDTALGANGFGVLDFAITDGTGEANTNILEPGESVVFVLAIAGTGPFSMRRSRLRRPGSPGATSRDAAPGRGAQAPAVAASASSGAAPSETGFAETFRFSPWWA